MKCLNKQYTLIVLWMCVFTQIQAQSKYPATFAPQFTSAADLLLHEEAELPYAYLAPLSKEELLLLNDFIHALYGNRPIDSIVWRLLPASAHASFKLKSSAVSERHEAALELIQSFQQTKDFAPSDNSAFFELLNGCWQEYTHNVGSQELSVLTIYGADRSYAFNQREQTYFSNGVVRFAGDNDHSGFITIDSVKMMFEMRMQNYYTITTTRFRNNKTGALDSVATDRKRETKEYFPYQYFSRKMGPLRIVETDGLTLYFFLLDNIVYWRIKANPVECD